MRVMAAKDGVQGRRRLRIFAAAVALVLLCAVCVGGVSGADVWDGTADTSWYTNNPSATTHTITTAEQLAGLAKLVNDGTQNFSERTIYLGADIDLDNRAWTSIGSNSSRPFSGTFDGQGYTISKLKQTLKSNANGGLFGYVVEGTITGVTLTDSSFSLEGTNIRLGSLVGVLEKGNVNNCVVSSVYITSNFDWSSNSFIQLLIMAFFGSHTVGGAVGINSGGVVSGYSISINVEENLFESVFNAKRCKYGPIVGDGEVDDAQTSYTISITVGEHGSANPNEDIVYLPDNTPTYSFTPDSGYAIEKIVIDGTDMTATIVSGDSHSTQRYTFEPIRRDHAISVTFRYSPEFTIIIPDYLNLSGDTKTGEMIVTAKDVWIPETDWISVRVASENDFNFIHSMDSSVLLTYALRVPGSSQTVSNDAEIMRVTQNVFLADGDGLLETTLNAQVTGTPKYAGLYEDSLTFTVQYGAA